jgi:hypothetical protein
VDAAWYTGFVRTWESVVLTVESWVSVIVNWAGTDGVEKREMLPELKVAMEEMFTCSPREAWAELRKTEEPKKRPAGV